MSNPKSPDIILARRASVAEWKNKNHFKIGSTVAEVDIETSEILSVIAAGYLETAREILNDTDIRQVQVLTLRFPVEGVYQVIGTAKTDNRPLCLSLPKRLHEKIPADLPLLPLTIIPPQ